MKHNKLIVFKIIVSLFLLSGCVSNKSHLENQRDKLGNLIINGTPVPKYKYPFFGQALTGPYADGTYGADTCAASLIDANWALTASHCTVGLNAHVQSYPFGLRVYISGSVTPNKDGVIIIPVKKYYAYHNNFTIDDYKNDITLIQLAQSVPASVATPVQLWDGKLPPKKSGGVGVLPPFFRATVIGVGETDGTSDNSHGRVLREALIPILPKEYCSTPDYHFPFNSEQNICAGSFLRKQGAYFGDSGGPLFFTRNGRFVQMGIVSRAYDDPNPGNKKPLPAVYTNVAYYKDWIECMISTSGNDSCNQKY